MNMRELGRGANSRLVMTCHLFRARTYQSSSVVVLPLLLFSSDQTSYNGPFTSFGESVHIWMEEGVIEVAPR
uniref:Uncharacterized protein n=1 Tax=Brassica oleracea var. oleracea TaxID=109376 RepID=A0A0D3C925_BRAOL